MNDKNDGFDLNKLIGDTSTLDKLPSKEIVGIMIDTVGKALLMHFDTILITLEKCQKSDDPMVRKNIPALEITLQASMASLKDFASLAIMASEHCSIIDAVKKS